jgi:hypothetical protein
MTGAHSHVTHRRFSAAGHLIIAADHFLRSEPWQSCCLNDVQDMIMDQPDLLSAYRTMFACPDEQMVAWWYCGTAYAQIPGLPELPVLGVETVMVYRTETIDADSFNIHWWEIGYFRDQLTGEVAGRWQNPITGIEVDLPKVLEEGPARITVSRNGDALSLDIDQHMAILRGADVSWQQIGDRLLIHQQERKARGLPRADGSLPEPGSPDVAEGITDLSIYASLADIRASDNVYPCRGSYTFGLDAPAPWMGFGEMEGRSLVRGRMDKVPVDEAVNPIAWRRLQELLPHAFSGESLKPRWTR